MSWFVVSDLHGRPERYEKLFHLVERRKPEALFLAGDLTPHGFVVGDFIHGFLIPRLADLRSRMGASYPTIFLILGNDDARSDEENILAGERLGLWRYLHERKLSFKGHPIFGLSFVPPSPFLLKDWERYDVSRFVDPGCIPPEEGKLTLPVDEERVRDDTIEKILENMTGGEDLRRSVFLFHAPPYQTKLDRAALDGKYVDHAPLDVHIGSIAIRRFIEERQPLVTLHGHVHESTSLTGSWRDRIGKTYCFNAAHEGPELSLVSFSPRALSRAKRELI